MGLRETTNYCGGSEGTPGNPLSYGERAYPQFAPLVDRLIGTAFATVKTVACHIEMLKYIANNMQAIVTLAQLGIPPQPTVTTAALGILVSEYLSSLPVYSGTGALPVETGQWYINNGKLEQAQ